MAASTLVAWAQTDGTEVAAASNAPVPLDRSDVAWVVGRGPVEIFAIRKDAQDMPGRRVHLATAHDGDVLFGWQHGDLVGQPPLLAVGHAGATLHVAARSDLGAACSQASIRDALLAAADRWIADLSAALARYGRPAPAAEQTAAAGDVVALQAGQRVMARKGVVWVTAAGGALELCDNAPLAFVEGGPAFPLAAETWLRATDAIELAVHDTAAMLRSGGVWPGLDAFHAAILTSLASDLNAAQAEDLARMRQRSRADQAVLETSLVKVAAVMGAPDSAGPGLDRAVEGALPEAVAIVAGYLGTAFHVPGTFVGGSTEADQLFQIARASGLRLRPVTLAKNWWRRSGQAMIAFGTEDGQVYALVPEGRDRYRLHRPGARSARPVDRALAGRIAPDAFAAYGRLPDHALGLRDLVVAGARFVRPDMVQFAAFLGLASLLGLLVPVVIGTMIETAIPFAEVPTIAILAGMLVAVAIGQLTFGVTRAVAMLRLETTAENHLQSGVVDRVLRLPASFFREYTVGDLTQGVMGLGAISRSVSSTAATAVFAGVFSLANFVLMYAYSPELSVVAALLLLVFLGVVVAGNYLQIQYEKSALHWGGQTSGLVTQLLVGISKIRIANAEPRAFGEWAARYANQRRRMFEARSVANGLTAFGTVFTALSSFAFFYLMAFALAEPISPASFIAFNAAYGQFLAAMVAMAGVFSGSMAAMAIYGRMKPILEAVPEVDDMREHPGILAGGIEVSHASFAYAPDLPDVLEDVSIAVKPGEFVALVGGSGAGKSTLLRLILGFETPRSGAVLFDGKDLAKLDPSVVRQQLGVVLQDGGLMPGSILDNVVGASSHTLEDAWAAARDAGIEDEIRAMPMGMHTVVSEGGGNLSGGQRQRLLIARALVNKPPILLFDEATSALDNVTQAIVTDSLELLKLTRLVVAHRLSTIEKADRIYVLDRGKVVEQGSFAELMAAEGHFKSLAARQLV